MTPHSLCEGLTMTLDDARKRIETAVAQYGHQAAPMIDLVMNEVRSDMGAKAFNLLIEEFDLELEYNIAPLDSDVSNS
ncbi:MAG TPA: hypothetical protein VFS39_09060 [Nitrospira sp.]|nr:hypothetical protein [Nitrospira sp.]